MKKTNINESRYKILLKNREKYTIGTPSELTVFFYTMEGFENNLNLLEKLKKTFTARPFRF